MTNKTDTPRTFRPQRRNANRHTPRGIGALESAMNELGYVAPMTAAADGEIIDGSARLEVAEDVFGDTAPLVVEHDGSRPIVMVRTDIPNADDPRAVRIALAANRIAQLDLDFDMTMLAALAADQPEVMAGLWSADEIEQLIKDVEHGIADVEAPGEFKEYDEDIDIEHECPKCGYKWSGGGRSE